MMKRILIIASACIIITACRKENRSSSSSIAGTWELTKSSGQIIIDYPPGNGTKWKFTGNTYEFYKDDTLAKSGNFELIKDNSVSESVCLVIPAGQYSNRIVYDNRSDSVKVFIQVSGNKLSMISGCYAYDAGSTQDYIRK
jgi:hypothetical protein